jgi:hypothetical protein
LDSGRVNAAGDIIATLSARVSELTKRVAMLQGELDSATKRLAVYEEHDASIQDALSTALKNAYQIRERAEIAAGQLLEQARDERRMLLGEITRLREERDQVQEEIAAQRRSSIAAVSSRPLSSDNAAAELRAVASEALKGLFQEIVDEIRTTERAARPEARPEPPREAPREAPQREEPRRAEPAREERRREPRVEIPRTEAPPMAEAPTYEAMKRIRRARVTEEEDLAPHRADFIETAQAVDALLSFETVEEAPAPEAVAEPEAVVEPEPEVVEEPQIIAEPEPLAEVEPEPITEVEPEPVAEAEPIAEAERELVVEPEPVARAEPIVEPEAPAASVEPIEEVESFEAPAPIAPEPLAPEPVAEVAPEPVVEVAPEPVVEIAPERVAEAPPPPQVVKPAPITYRPPMDWRSEPAPQTPPPPTRPTTALPPSFADSEASTVTVPPPAQPQPQRPAASLPTSFETHVNAVDPRLQALAPTPQPRPVEPRPPLEVVRAPVDIRETHHPRVEAASPTSDIQLVLSPVPSFPRLVEIERRIQSLPVVRTLYVRDFRAGAATLAVSLRSAMTPEEFASILAGLQQPRLRLIAGSRNTLELRIEGEAGVA